jgi:biopolymer transport protein ExbD
MLLLGCGVSDADFQAVQARQERMEEAFVAARNKIAMLEEKVESLQAGPAAAPSRPDAIDLELPRAASPDAISTTTSLVTLTPDATFVDGMEVDDAEFDAAMHKLHDADPEASVILSVDASVPHRDAVALLDRIKSVGISKFSLAVAAGVAPTRKPGAKTTPELENPFSP